MYDFYFMSKRLPILKLNHFKCFVRHEPRLLEKIVGYSNPSKRMTRFFNLQAACATHRLRLFHTNSVFPDRLVHLPKYLSVFL